jgi:RimJ/RimL family protein N-acetyltransferase
MPCALPASQRTTTPRSLDHQKGRTFVSTATTTEATTKPSPAPGTGSADQTFSVGETIYLRGMEVSDAKYVRAWRFEPFPIYAEKAEELLKEKIPSDAKNHKRWMMIVRRSDDVPVGSVVWFTYNYQSADIELHLDPILAPDTQSAICAEVYALLVPYFLHEREFLCVQVAIPEGDAIAYQGALAAGFADVARLREALLIKGERRNQVCFEVLHPGWLKTFGDPRLGDAALREQVAAQRAEFAARPPHKRWIGSLPPDRMPADVPPTALAVGERIYIRPLEPADADDMAAWSRKETETFFDNGRSVGSGISLTKYIRSLVEDDFPTDLRFAIVARDGDVLIGDNGVDDIDWIHRTAETASFFHRPDYRGSGYGTEAKHLLLEFVFERLGLHAVRSYVWQHNSRSAAALRKQGYRDAGIFHWDGFKNAAPANSLMFDFLADEWRALRDEANAGA